MSAKFLLALTLVNALILGVGCLGTDVSAQDDVPALGSSLLDLSKALNTPNRKLDRSLEDGAFLEQACAYDPTLLKPFGGYTLKVLRGAAYVGVLVCDGEGRKAYFEDLSCTGDRPEKNHSRATLNPPCAFTLDPDLDCPRPKAER